MAINAEMLAAMVQASRFSSAQLDRMAQAVLGTSLAEISNQSTPELQAQDMIKYAEQYGLLREFAASVLYTGADKPALQNLLLSDEDMETNRPTDNYTMLRIESKVDRLLEEQQRMAQQQSQMAQQQAGFDRRLYTLEATAARTSPPSNMDRMMVVMMVVIMIAMLGYNVFGGFLP